MCIKISLVNNDTSLSVKFGWGKISKDWNVVKPILDYEQDDVKKNSLNVDYKYDPVYSNHKTKQSLLTNTQHF